MLREGTLHQGGGPPGRARERRHEVGGKAGEEPARVAQGLHHGLQGGRTHAPARHLRVVPPEHLKLPIRLCAWRGPGSIDLRRRIPPPGQGARPLLALVPRPKKFEKSLGRAQNRAKLRPHGLRGGLLSLAIAGGGSSTVASLLIPFCSPRRSAGAAPRVPLRPPTRCTWPRPLAPSPASQVADPRASS